MLTLYYKPTCIHSQTVLGEAEDMGLSFNLKDVSTDVTLLGELLDKGGRDQTPFLVDAENDVKLYESKDIVDYLHTYAEAKKKESFGGLRIHHSDEACDTCQ